MPINVKIVEWQPGWEIPLHELDREMFDTPPIGSRYWRGNVAMRERDVEGGDPLRVHLERDLAREHEVLTGLPQGCTVDCGRDSETGQWHAIVDRGVTTIASAIGDDCDDVVREAIAAAAAQ